MTNFELYKARLERLANLKLNLDLERREDFTTANGWNLDQYEADLPPEATGEPCSNGSFKAAQAVLREYRFPPPDLITGIFLPDQPLEQRVMLLRANFLGLQFFFGVKVCGVTNELRQVGNGQERLWGYRYATLEGHFERGQIEFLIAKNLQTGTVQFRIDAFSKTGLIENVFYRVGFWLFGRRLQKRFARQSLTRMQLLVAQALSRGDLEALSRGDSEALKIGSSPEIKIAPENSVAKAKLEELTPKKDVPS